MESREFCVFRSTVGIVDAENADRPGAGMKPIEDECSRPLYEGTRGRGRKADACSIRTLQDSLLHGSRRSGSYRALRSKSH